MSNIITKLQLILFDFIYIKNRILLSVRSTKYGSNLQVFTSFLTQDVAKVVIGNNVLIGRNCRFYGGSGIIIGDNVLIANDVSIISVDHNFSSKKIPINKQGIETSNQPVIIGDDVLIGDKAIILKKVRIGKGAIIGAGSVVNKDIPEYSIAVGNPAKVVKKR